ncbi:MAG: hypothetical protein CM1200mP39_29360 [Dehalococcoidia bacterium]|nr:MAG: hypothetical protein CM1200mP39_29360 [Dehalococcoidia bacterium]
MDETTKRKNILSLWRVFHTDSDNKLSIEQFDDVVTEAIPQELIRRSSFMEHEIFHRYHSETEMMRYLRRTASKDISLGRSMIPLGSCTMKLNATSQMLPLF